MALALTSRTLWNTAARTTPSIPNSRIPPTAFSLVDALVPAGSVSSAARKDARAVRWPTSTNFGTVRRRSNCWTPICLNLAAGGGGFADSITIQPRADSFNGVRTEYSDMLQNQLAKGNNGLTKTKYLTFGIEAENIRAAKPRLERIETDILNNFKRLGVTAVPLNGADRLRLMHDIFHMDGHEQFNFSWDWLAPSGLSVKDFIAPSSFEFRNGRMFRMGRKYGAVSFVQIMAPELNDRMLADFLDMESSLIVNLHIQSVDQVNAIKTVKRKITDLDSAKLSNRKRRSGPGTTWT